MRKMWALLLAVLAVALISVPAFTAPTNVADEWEGIPDVDRSHAVSPNPPPNPDGSFPDGQRPEIIDVPIETIMVPSIPETGSSAAMKGDPKKGIVVVVVNGSPVAFPDQQPYIDATSHTMVPIRFVAEALGAQVACSKDGVVSIDRGNTQIKLKIGESKATVNGAVKTFDTKSVLTKKFRTMVPLRFVSEALGAKVSWNQETYTVSIDI